MLKKTARFLFAVRPGTSPTYAFYSGFFAGAMLTIYTARLLADIQEQREWKEHFAADAFKEEDREIQILKLP